ncbi:sulfurtransferase [Tersicoccus solisilvae]|uniref:Sulfurtransferase n=1 Tax=Tersicoccus solisilvae TaxID=1882339 RepID=A0ABQ1NHT4_9MICC|nr:rhodanese-like domain-containing protein [Tersicoccus solisilvae]GGC77585.1 sulfurtransferase [Tersicoccus solisilvae]
MDSLPSVTVDAITDDTTVLDVREDDEWEAGHIAHARHIPLGDIMVRYGELPADEEIHVICRTGGRSSRVTAWLNQNGFDAVNVSGGMGAWMDAERDMVSETDAAPYVK